VISVAPLAEFRLLIRSQLAGCADLKISDPQTDHFNDRVWLCIQLAGRLAAIERQYCALKEIV